MRYHDYLRSGEWRLRRRYELERAGHCCEFCGDGYGRLNVHHLSYEHLGYEMPEDLIVLCTSCHQDAHDFPHTIGEDIKRLAARRPVQPGSLEALIVWVEQTYIPRIA